MAQRRRLAASGWLVMMSILSVLAATTPLRSSHAQAVLDTPSPAASPAEIALDASAIDPYEGLVRPSQQVQLNAPMPGILQAVLVEEGQHVQQGQVLAQIDDRLQRLAVEAAQLQAQSDAEVERARYAMDEAKILWDRAVWSSERDAASDWEVRRAKVQYLVAQAAYQAALEAKELAQVKLKLEQERLEQYQLRAPFAGQVVQIHLDAGGTVSTSDPILSLVAMDPLEAEVHLSIDVMEQMEPGRWYRLSGAAPVNRELLGRLISVDPRIDWASRTFRCLFRLENPGGKLPSGFGVRLAAASPVEPPPPSAPAASEQAPTQSPPTQNAQAAKDSAE